MNPPPPLVDHDAPLSDLALWAIGAPAGALLVVLTSMNASRWDGTHPENVIAAVICLLIAALLAWNLAWSVVAHLAVARVLPSVVARALSSAVLRAGTRRAKQIVLRSGAGAALGIGVMISSTTGAAFALPMEQIDEPQSTTASSYDLAWGAPQTPRAQNHRASGNAEGHSQRFEQSSDSPKAGSEESSTTSATEAPGLSSTDGDSQPSPATPARTPAARTPDARTAPDAGAVTDAPTASSTATHGVAAGESLWSISASLLGPDATDDAVAQLWPRLYELNRAVIGADPGLIRPGQILTIPEEIR